MKGLFGEQNERAKRNGTHPHRELFEALCLACELDWHDFTKRERGKVQKAAAELFEVGATVLQIQQRAAEYKRAFPGAAMTPCAISGQWTYLGTRLKPNGSHTVCDVSGHVFEAWASACTRCGRVAKP